MEIYIARTGDTIDSAARRFGTDAAALSYSNQLGDPRRLTSGMALAIPSPDDAPQSSMEICASVYPSIPDSVLSEFLPSLSFICPFCRRVTAEGTLLPLEEGRLVSSARKSRTIPLLTVANIGSGGGFSGALAHELFASVQSRQALLESILAAVAEGGYGGVQLNFGYLYPFDRSNYNSFLRLCSDALHEKGLYLTTAIAPREDDAQESPLCAAHDYAAHGRYADRVVLLTYDWGYMYSAPQAVSPVNRIRAVLDYAVEHIPSGKILLGISNYGYNWNLPWRQGDSSSLISHASAVNLAVSAGAEIKFDASSRASFFTYTDGGGQRHVVWFEDVRSVQARLSLVREYSLAGISHWTVNRLYRPGMLLTQSLYSAEKLL